MTSKPSSLTADVVIPIYGDLALTRRCIDSVLEHDEGLARLILVHDAGPEPKMSETLAAYRLADARVQVLENEHNLGFVASANRGLSLRTRHAVLLNSDAEVTQGWLPELLGVLEDAPHLAAVSPLSNNGGLCSVPTFSQATPSKQVQLERTALNGLPRWTEMPTAVGFCMALRHEALSLVGLLDPHFGRGYHEENDWCQRARALGFIVARANHAYVRHEGGVSFSEERTVLENVNAQKLSHRHPHFERDARVFASVPAARFAATAVQSAAQLRIKTTNPSRFTGLEAAHSGEHDFLVCEPGDVGAAVEGVAGVAVWWDDLHLLDVPNAFMWMWTIAQAADVHCVATSYSAARLHERLGVPKARIHQLAALPFDASWRLLVEKRRSARRAGSLKVFVEGPAWARLLSTHLDAREIEWVTPAHGGEALPALASSDVAVLLSPASETLRAFAAAGGISAVVLTSAPGQRPNEVVAVSADLMHVREAFERAAALEPGAAAFSAQTEAAVSGLRAVLASCSRQRSAEISAARLALRQWVNRGSTM